jgi:hypothetical protein
MGPHDAVRIDTRKPPEPPRRGVVAASVVLLLLVVGVLLGVGHYDDLAEEAPEETIPDIGPDPLEQALLVVEDFAAAWNGGDAAAVGDLIPEEWEWIQLPGLSDGWLTTRDGRAQLETGIGFITSVSRISLGRCDAELGPPDSPTTAVVRCNDAGFVSDYLDALERNMWEDTGPRSPSRWGPRRPGILFGIQRGSVISVELETDPYTPHAYCVWAELNHPERAAFLFDLHCRPNTTEATSDAHAELAEAFMAAGAPFPTRQVAEARLAASYVARFAELHNLVDTATVDAWLSPQVEAASLPGFAGGEAPAVADYLTWSARLMDISTGLCSVEFGDGVTVVTCPDLTVAGVLFDQPVPQPTVFTVDSNRRGDPVARSRGRILAVEPLSDDHVPIEEICRRLRGLQPTAAAAAFADECTPEYTRDAAVALAKMMEQT